MKKITRKDFEGLRQQYPVLTQDEMRRYVGGYSDNSCNGDWFASELYLSDFGVSVFSSGGYGGYGGYDDGGGDIDGGELGEVVIYGHYTPKYYEEQPKDNEEQPGKFNPDWDYYDPWGDDSDSDDNNDDNGYPGFYYYGYDDNYGYEYWGGNSGGGGGGSGDGSSDSDTLSEILSYLKGLLSSSIAISAEVAHNIYEYIVPLMLEHPDAVGTVKSYLTELKWLIGPTVESDPNKMGWDDLFSIWLFELNASNMEKDSKSNLMIFTFTDNAQTTKDLQQQEGVLKVRNMAIEKIKNGSLDYTHDSWTYGVPEFFDGIINMNEVTSFLGSYNTGITIEDNHNGTYTLNYTVSNNSGWESATRLRVAHTAGGPHEGIIPNCDRDATLGLGGTISEKWTWSETISIK